MWDHLPVHNMISLQRAAAYKRMGQRAAELLAEGYAVEADRILDEMIERKRQWEQEKW
jgi:predicted kinase